MFERISTRNGGRTCHLKSFTLWLSHGTATMVSNKSVPSPSWPGKRSPMTQSSRAWGSGLEGEWNIYNILAVSSNIHLSWKLLSQGKLFPAWNSIKHKWHFNEAKSGISAISRDEHRNINFCLPLFDKNLGFRLASLNVCPTLKL